ncbi:Fic/DOC family protein [Actinokineospora spheciospongiae]|uniref:Fic/DOC family protein n=1 Tax=Actinokineospora spheciospongiae TaxID=909613 RepID=UPI0039885570
MPGEYNSQHLQAFHRHLFRDVYDWAGDFRTVDISKGNVRFAHWNYLNDSVSAVLGQLKDDYWLANLRRDHFIKRLAFYYGELNVCHPFREGNGLTQRAFLRQLSASAGWRLDWTELPPRGQHPRLRALCPHRAQRTAGRHPRCGRGQDLTCERPHPPRADGAVRRARTSSGARGPWPCPGRRRRTSSPGRTACRATGGC